MTARAAPAAAVALLAGAAFSMVPDVDFALLPVLHHRSILTHSILPPLCLLMLRWRFARAAAAGAFMGIGAHLAVDAISPPVGFAKVWLPWPIKTSLGDLSPLWLAGSAAASFALGLRGAERALPGQLGRAAAPTAAAIGTALYASGERAPLAATAAAAALFALGAFVWRRFLRAG